MPAEIIEICEFVSSRPRIGPRTMHQISLPKCALTPDGSNKVAGVKVSVGDRTGHELLMEFDKQS